ncbi:PAS domain-containing sensor histidine kinase [Polaribacter sp. KT 15]|uniref:PAS domain-containing sensor histidine kinase n=1 Tax=Polaribacter sp. KT 15 TaxID=1896175 RepID=UPI00090B2B5E|nr:PAS domain-containing sensor histidine kinase [Polaribacter sp. KT 15]SHN09196.1 PAS/PAC sensor signal transduction histidine kinase [Polaribacter sp. KT 15]
MSQEKIDILERALKREKAARKAAEKILEDKSRDLYFVSDKLKDTNNKLEILLDEKSSQLEGVFENLVDAFVVMDLSGKVIKFNEAAIDVFGYDIENENLNVKDLVYKEDMGYAISSFFDLITDGHFKNYESRICTKSKEVKWVHINASLIYNKDKHPIAAQGIVRDITEQKAADEKLLESKNRLSALVLNLNSGIILEDEHRKIVLTNNKFCQLFRIEENPEDLYGKDSNWALEEIKTLFKKPDEFENRITEIVNNKVAVFGDHLELKDGTVLERNYMPITVSGNVNGFLWTFRDITLEKNYSLSLEAQKAKYSNIIANMNLGLIELNTDNEILMVNQSFVDMSGYSKEELIGQKGNIYFPLTDLDTEKLKEQRKKRHKGESDSYDLKVKTKSGEVRHWLVSGAPNYNLSGEVVGSIGINLDITEFKKLQIQKEKILKELEKRNEELHEYAHIVSHDLKSPLRSIDALVSWIKADNEGKFDEITQENFNLIDNTLETMETLISNVLEYSSAGSNTNSLSKVNLNTTVNNLIKVLFVPENISINIINKLPIVKGDETKFQQLFQNFISNAIKFCDKEVGLVEIEYQDKNTFHQFSIKDNGIGIEKKYHEKIFQVFHSLNKRKDSTGIGLSIVKKIIDLHEGDIWLESEPNVGTTFFFTLKKN